MLKEGARARFTSPMRVRDILMKAAMRYTRYLVHIQFSEYNCIEIDINKFLQGGDPSDMRDLFNLMKKIDNALLDVIGRSECEAEVECEEDDCGECTLCQFGRLVQLH